MDAVNNSSGGVLAMGNRWIGLLLLLLPALLIILAGCGP